MSFRGGADSVCLLDVLAVLQDELSMELVVAHFDHGLRPGEDEAETRFVAALSAQRNLSFYTRQGRLDAAKGSLEARAREARYQFLEEARAHFSAHKIAGAHQCNDQAETVLMRLLRGSGTSGLSGIPPMREGTIVRPLLDLHRSEIERYLKDRNLSFRIDPTNRSDRFLRNRIRSFLIPALQVYQPRLIEVLSQTADILREDDHYLETVSQEWLLKHGKIGGERVVEISVTELVPLPSAMKRRVIRRCVRMVVKGLSAISLKHIDAVGRLAKGTKPQGTIRLPKGILAQRSYDRLIFKTGAEEDASGYSYMLQGPGSYFLKELSGSLRVEEFPRARIRIGKENRWTAFLDAQKVRYPLVLRTFRPGDTFVPLGMAGHKKVKDFFIDRKVPREVRAKVPILMSGGKIAWIGGMMISDRFRVSSGTERILKITINSAHVPECGSKSA
ncbi:MAG: tRNA lysidine(34) synthetase TilS [Deltaproteobacteria bacterium]